MIKMNLNIKIAEKNITKKQLAEETGIGKNTIGLYCSGDYKKIDKEHLDIFCKYFNCSVYDLIQFEYESETYSVAKYRIYLESELANMNQRITYLKNEINQCNMILHGKPEVSANVYSDFLLKMGNEHHFIQVKPRNKQDLNESDKTNDSYINEEASVEKVNSKQTSKDDTIYKQLPSEAKNNKDLERFSMAQEISYDQSYIKPSDMKYSKKSKEEELELENAKKTLLDSGMFNEHIKNIVEHVLFEVLKDKTMDDNPIKIQLNKKLKEYNTNKVK